MSISSKVKAQELTDILTSTTNIELPNTKQNLPQSLQDIADEFFLIIEISETSKNGNQDYFEIIIKDLSGQVILTINEHKGKNTDETEENIKSICSSFINNNLIRITLNSETIFKNIRKRLLESHGKDKEENNRSLIGMDYEYSVLKGREKDLQKLAIQDNITLDLLSIFIYQLETNVLYIGKQNLINWESVATRDIRNGYKNHKSSFKMPEKNTSNLFSQTIVTDKKETPKYISKLKPGPTERENEFSSKKDILNQHNLQTILININGLSSTYRNDTKVCGKPSDIIYDKIKEHPILKEALQLHIEENNYTTTPSLGQKRHQLSGLAFKYGCIYFSKDITHPFHAYTKEYVSNKDDQAIYITDVHDVDGSKKGGYMKRHNTNIMVIDEEIFQGPKQDLIKFIESLK